MLHQIKGVIRENAEKGHLIRCRVKGWKDDNWLRTLSLSFGLLGGDTVRRRWQSSNPDSKNLGYVNMSGN